jgi:DNA-binding beta-propeller fold protein YncE
MKKLLLIPLSFLIYQSAIVFAGESVTAETPIILEGPVGKFDFMATDATANRILAAHRGAKTLEVIDLNTGKPTKSVEVGHAQGVAIDLRGHKYFLGNEAEESIAIVDSQSLAKIGEVKVDGPVDAIAFDEKNGLLYAAKDDGDYLWVINPKASNFTDKIAIPGTPEVLEYDQKTDRIYLNIKNKNEVVRINPTKNKVEATWSTLPATSPHGLAIDSKRGRFYVAGGNGKLVSLDMKTGKVLSSVDIANGVDQIVFDMDSQLIYSACRGFISISKVTDAGLVEGNKIPSPKGAHTLAIDPNSHDVWVSYADDNHSYVQKFRATR